MQQRRLGVGELSVGTIGLSGAGVPESERAHAIHPVATLLSEPSPRTRDVLGELLQRCVARDVAFIAYAPTGRGLLTGAFTAASFADNDVRAHNLRFRPEALAANRLTPRYETR